MFEIRIEQNKAWVLRRETLTAYSEGCEAVRLRLDFDAAWEGLAKIAVFRACDAQIDLALSGDTAAAKFVRDAAIAAAPEEETTSPEDLRSLPDAALYAMAAEGAP